MRPRLLVLELHHLGDAVLAIPFLRTAMIHADMAVFCTPSVSELLRTLVPDLKTLPARPSWPGRILQMISLRRTFRPTVAVSAWADVRASVLGWVSGAQRRIGLPMRSGNYYAAEVPWRQRRLRAGRGIDFVFRMFGISLLTDSVNRPDNRCSHLAVWGLLASKLGWTAELRTPWFEPPREFLGAELESFLAEHRRAGRKICVLHAGGRLPTKRWPVAAYQKVLETFFVENGIAVVIVKHPGEDAPTPVGSLQCHWDCFSHAALATCLASADVVLCNDSYPAHLASGLGKTVVTIFGSGEPAWFAPYGNESHVVRSTACPFHPCIDRCRMPSVVCLDSVQTAQVIERLRPLFVSERNPSGK